ncbi:MAG: TRAP transporter large permease [Chitinispirillaceae bacterium]|nr:TRAP transporter large permease [Chitinispirillaceae bacterium]
MSPVFVLGAGFVVLLVMNVPIAFAIGIATLLTILSIGNIPALTIIAQKMATGIDTFALLAIPFFILSGLLMGRGGIARRLIDFAGALVGWLPGGLSYVNVLTCMMFGSISGSAVAAVSAIGGFMMPEMNRKKYDQHFNVSVTVTAATTGLLIPPSNAMIVYSLAAGSVSIAAIFLAGILPGILVGLCIMTVCGIISVKRRYGGGERTGFKEVMIRFKRAFLSLLLVFIVMGGIIGGIFTATEAAAIAVVYAFILSVIVYREVKPRDIPKILLDTGITTAVVMLLIATSTAMSWILAYENIPQTISTALLAVSDNTIVIMLIINTILLIVGTFMDMTPAILIFTPILLPVVTALGINPIHFGVLLIANLCIGLCTPPVGTALFVGCGIGKTTIAKVTPSLIPFFIAMIAALMLITYIPAVSMFVPGLFGFK